MAYTESMLSTEWIPQVRFPDGDNVNLVTLQEAIQEQADKNGIPVAFREDQVKVGGMFSKQLEDILVMYNPEHPSDYLKFAIRVQHQGRYAFMHVYNLGGSKNYKNVNKANANTTGGLVRGLVNMAIGTKNKLQEEENYYTILADCLSNVVG